MEAASIAWRPLGRLLVEQGLLTNEELELALAKQQITGRRLGETIVECGFVSRPELSNALAAQYGIELKTETGFGTGLRAQIQQRHESDRGRVVHIGLAKPLEQVEEELPAEPELELEVAEQESQQSAELLAQLEEQWAKLAAAEEELAEREAALAAAVVERDGRRAQAARLARLARTARAEQSGHRERRRALTLRFLQRLRERDDQIQGLTADLERVASEQQDRLAAIDADRAELERALMLVSAARDHRRAQAERFVQRLRAREQELERCEQEYRQLGEALGDQADERKAALAAAAEREVALERALAELATDWDHRHAQAGRFARRARTLAQVVDGLRAEAERLTHDVRGCDAEIERLRQENARRRAQASRFAGRLRAQEPEPEPQPELAAPTSHLLFVHAAGGYTLVEREGPPPAPRTQLELPDLDGGSFVVSTRRRSPLPGDLRPCVVAEPA